MGQFRLFCLGSGCRETRTQNQDEFYYNLHPGIPAPSTSNHNSLIMMFVSPLFVGYFPPARPAAL